MAVKSLILLGGILILAVLIDSKSLGENNSTSTRTLITKRTIFPPRTTRTELKVARSLNPDDMQTLNVRTKSGQVTQLIVKRRGRNNALNTSPAPQNSSESSTTEQTSTTTQESTNGTEKSLESSTRPFIASQPLFHSSRHQPAEGRKLYDDNELDGNLNDKISRFNKYYVNVQRTDDESATIQAEYGNWSPVTRNAEENLQSKSKDDPDIDSDDKDDEDSDMSESNEKKSRVYITSASYAESRSKAKPIDPDTSSIVTSNDRNPVHIEVVSTKVEDDIKARASVPKPVYIRSDEVFIKGKPENIDFRRQKSVLTIGKDGIPEVHGVRMPDDESDTKVWRNARVINGELLPYPVGYKPKLAYPETEEVEDDTSESFGPFVKEDNFQDSTDNQGYGPFSADDNLRNEQSDSIGPFLTSDNPTYSKKNLISTDFLRKGYGPFTKTDNSRAANTKLIEYIKQINDHEAKRDYFARNSRSEKESNPVRFPQSENQLQRRMLQHPGIQNFPTSQMYEYTPKAEALIAPFNDGVRNPVLQYAHPELGVQPAKTAAQNAEKAKARSKPQKVIYYEDTRSPYTLEPAGTTENYELSEDHLHRANQYKSNKYYDNSEYSYNRYNYYRPELSKHNYGYIRRVQERPLWQRLTDSMKETFQSGVETVQQFTKPILEPIAKVTRPVLEPLMEATQKISQNLGFSNNPKSYYGHGYSVAEDKIGTVAAGASSVVLPALGLVAGGAALGLGAVAVGRFLDIDLMRSSGWSDDMINKYIEMEHKRSAHLNWMRAMQEQNDQDKEYLANQKVYSDNVKMPSENVVVIMEAPKGASEQRRLKRSVDANDFAGSFDDIRRVKRKETYLDSDISDLDLQSNGGNTQNDKFDQFSDIIDVYNAPLGSEHEILSNVQRIIDYTDNYDRKNQHSIRKRSIYYKNGLSDEDDTMEMFIQSLEADKIGQGLASDVIAHIHRTDWSNTPCAKKTFCEVMSAQPADELFQMEKKMDSFLKVVHPSVATSVSSHLSDVMAAIRRNDCSEFKCRQT